MCFESHANQKESHCRLSFQSHRTSLYSRSHIHEIYQVKCFVMFSFTEELEEASSKIMVWSVFEQFKRFFFHV